MFTILEDDDGLNNNNNNNNNNRNPVAATPLHLPPSRPLDFSNISVRNAAPPSTSHSRARSNTVGSTSM